MRVPETLGATCDADGCQEAAEVGLWCPAHALARYKRDTLRPLPARWQGAQEELQRCVFSRCPRVASDGPCAQHRKQLQKRGSMSFIAVRRRPGAAGLRDEVGRKECGGCLEWLPTSDYGRDASQVDGLRNACTRCDALRVPRKRK